MQNANNLIIALSALIPFSVSMAYGETRPSSEPALTYQGDVDYYFLWYYSDRLKNAEELFAATLFDQAALKYEDILRSLEPKNLTSASSNQSELYLMAVCRLGQIHYFKNDYALANSYFEKPRASLQSLSPELKKLEMQIAYMQAVSSRRLGLHNAAQSALARYAEIAGSMGETIIFEVHFEKGLNFYHLGNLNLAKEEFQELNQKLTQNVTGSNKEIFLLSQLYIGRIGISEGDYEQSDALLAELAQSSNLQFLSKGSAGSLLSEIEYLRGEIAFHQGNFLLATEFILRSLSKDQIQGTLNWTPNALGLLGWSYLKLAESADGSLGDRSEMFANAEKYFKKAIDVRGSEEDYLALAQSYLAKSRRLQDPEALKSAEQILRQGGEFKSSDAKIKKLLLRAEIAGSYSDKEKLYAQLTTVAPQFADGWLKRGMNDYSQGESSKIPQESKLAFKRAAASLGMAYSLLQAIDQREAEIALKMFMRAQLQEGSRESLINVIDISEALTKNDNAVFSKMQEQKEIYFLYGQAACRLADTNGGDQYSGIAEKALWTSALEVKGEKYGDESLNLLGNFYLHRDENLKSEEAFLHLIAHYPQSQYAGDALYYCAENAEKLGKDPEQIRKYRQQLYTHYPQSPYAPSAYFHYYPYREYLQGDKDALKHLKNFLEIFPENPLAITASFLMGLDYKRDRKTIEGRSIRKKNLLKAIESFADVDNLFDSKKHLISEAEMPYYVNIRYRALLERALANQVISGESQGTKQEIYFQYAEELYRQIFREFADPKHPLASSLTKIEPFPKVYEESLHALIKGYRNTNDVKSATRLIGEALGKYQELGKTSGYYLSRIHYENGKIEMLNKNHALALEAFIRAEESNKGKFLSTDQKLDLWIQQAMCNKSLGQMDKAMLILSKVINDDAVSGQRLKAMYLRAEIYELQGRPELARKQLEATAKKGGDWAHKAKVKLDSEYGY